ncbi:MAG: nucleotide pyrophosphatase/phosphodiesterase family protein [Thermoanaerobaculia bacterium]
MSTRRSLSWAVLGSLALSCHGAPPPPAGGPHAPIRRVVLLSLDGANAGRLQRLYREGKLTAGGFSRFFQEGQVADRLIPVDPALTSPNHISLATGYPAGQTGIVSNLFHPAGAPFVETVSGFAAPIGTETLWEAARRQGKRVGVNSWPGADNTSPRRRADWGMAYTNTPDRPAALVTVESGRWRPVAEAAKALGTALAPRSESTFPLSPGRWADLPCRITPREGSPRNAVCQVKLLAPDPGGTTRLYFSAVYPFPVYPEEFASALAGQGLFWPGPPDDDRLIDSWNGRPGIDLATWLEQSGRFARFFGDALLAAAQRPDWDLLMGYMPVIDEAEHKLQLTDPRQPGFTPERRDAFEAARTRVWQDVDRELARLLAGLDLKTTVIAVVSDHGMAPVHTHVNLNVLLQEKGLLAADAKGKILEEGTAAYAVGDGGLVHVYVKPGRADLVPTLRALFTGWKVEGETPVERAFTRREAAEVHLDHPNSGDLVLFLREGYMSEDGLTDGRAVSPTGVFGMHGYLSSHPEMQGIYMALGAGIAPGNAGTVRNLEVAGRVAGWLGIGKPRKQAKGTSTN